MNLCTIEKFPRKIMFHAWPNLFWRRYRRIGQGLGFDKLYLALSFDCDTKEDAAVVLKVDSKLRELGVNPMYAVPGILLESDRSVYMELFQQGAEFLNHGYVQHTRWDKTRSRYESCYFYDNLDLDEISNDILRGQYVAEKILGVQPKGFRTPHFGTFQSKSDLNFLHSFLAEHGYVYSSSTMPLYSYDHGPAHNVQGVIEYPLSGAYSRPWAVQDSWAYFAAPDRIFESHEYVNEAKNMTLYCKKRGMVGILNYYADPSHIWDKPEFFEAVSLWSEVAQPVQLGDLSKILS